MALSAGTRLGPYEILALAGAGGMGEVYKARDMRLDRTVAIKVLPEALAADPQFRDRFDREARTISQLDHPHICALYDVGEHDGTAYLVMQYLEGETLEDRLKKGALPLEQALQYAVQIVDALDKAHRAGIVHRDLKPSNIMVTKAGAKLLDFGLAKISARVAAGGLSMLPTTPPSLTAQGAMLGTFQYMAPEQIEGEEADARTDMFAFGVVLYEMLTGKKAFGGKTQASLFGAILKEEPPPISTVQPLTPPLLDRVVKKCLAKDPDARWHSAHDLHDELQWIAETRSDTDARTLGASTRRSARALAFGAALAVAVATSIAIWALARPLSTAARRPARLSVTLPIWDQIHGVAISPDGNTVVYSATRDGVRRLYRRFLDQLDVVPIAGTEQARYPFFSPDGAWLGFEAALTLKKVSVTGGLPATIYDGTNKGATIASWGMNDNVAFQLSSDGTPLQRVSASGGSAQALTTLSSEPGETRHVWPELMPGGRAVLFTVEPSNRIMVQSLDTGRRHLITEGQNAHYVPTDHIVFLRGTSLWAVPFDLRRLEANGPPTEVVEKVTGDGDPYTSTTPFAIARNAGTLVYLRGPMMGMRTIVWVDRNGHEEPLSAEARMYTSPRISPDGKRVALSVSETSSGNSHIWVYDLARPTRRRN